MESLDLDYYSTVLEAVAGTPLVRLNRIMGATRTPVLAKLEYLNPGGSAKDRIAVAMIEHAERAGLLRAGGTIVEPSSGNTGTALAMVAAVRGYRCIVVVPEKTSAEKIATMRAFGAEVVIAPSVPPGSPEAYTAVAARLAREIPGAYMPDQYVNPANPLAHERTTGVEIWEQTGGRVTHFIAGLGTGGTLCGAARALKARNPQLCAVGVDPVGSIYSGGMPGAFAVEGVGRHYLPQTLDLRVIDRMERVGDREAFMMARRAARDEGLLVGGSAGAALVAAQRIAREVDGEGLIVVLLADSGRSYLSKFFDDEWLERAGIAGAWATPLRDVLARPARHRRDLFVDSSLSARSVQTLLLEAGVDEVAVVDDDYHVGRISLTMIIEALRARGPGADPLLAEVMGPPYPMLDESAPIDEAFRALRLSQPYVIVTRHGKAVAALAARDLSAYA